MQFFSLVHGTSKKNQTECILVGADFRNLKHEMASSGKQLTKEESWLSVYTYEHWGYRWKGEWYVFFDMRDKTKFELSLPVSLI